MVKGLSRRVVLVKYPDAGVFEQALFVVRDDALVSRGVSADDVLAEACQIANQQSGIRKSVKRKSHWIYLLIGAGSVGVAWAVSLLAG